MTVTPLISVLTSKPLTGSNFLEWKRTLKYVLVAEEYDYVLTIPKPPVLTDNSTPEQKEEMRRWLKADNMARCYMMTSMSPTLQQHQEIETAAGLMLNLEELYGGKDRSPSFQLMRKILSMKMVEGSSVNEHVLSLMNCMNEFDLHGGGLDFESKSDIILHSLPMSFETFILNAVMSNKEWTLNKLLNDLIVAKGVMGNKY